MTFIQSLFIKENWNKKNYSSVYSGSYCLIVSKMAMKGSLLSWLPYKLGRVRIQIVIHSALLLLVLPSAQLPHLFHIFCVYTWCWISEVILVVDFLMLKIHIQILCHNMAVNFKVTSVTHYYIQVSNKLIFHLFHLHASLLE